MKHHSQIFLILASALVFNSLYALQPTCLTDETVQTARSTELQELVNADQAGRQNWNEMSMQDKEELAEKDLIRRKRVGEILAEGCFKTAKDYAAAALIYHHGKVPDHYYSAFTWALKSLSLHGENSGYFVAVTIDRYLVSTGHKQLFGTQFFMNDKNYGCHCMQQTELTFPDSLRLEYTGLAFQQLYELGEYFNVSKEHCPRISECELSLEPTPQGSVIGFW